MKDTPGPERGRVFIPSCLIQICHVDLLYDVTNAFFSFFFFLGGGRAGGGWEAKRWDGEWGSGLMCQVHIKGQAWRMVYSLPCITEQDVVINVASTPTSILMLQVVF